LGGGSDWHFDARCTGDDMGRENSLSGRRTVRQLTWALTATLAGRLLSFVGLVVLARFLAPEDFGLFATALVFVTYVETIGDLGTGAALVYWPDRPRDAAQLTFAVNVLMGCAWFVVAQGAALSVARFFQNADAAPVLQAIAWVLPIKFLGQTHDAWLQRDIRFRARALPEVALALAKLVLSIGLAVRGFGVWSLVWGQIGGQLAWTAGVWLLVPWRPGWRIPLDLLGPMLRYGRGLIAVGVLSAIVHHADLVIVGRMLGTTELGWYRVASRLPELAIALMVWVAGKVFFPTFARLNADGGGRLGEAYLSVLRYLTILSLTAAAVLFFAAEPIVVVLFGEAWRPAAPILRGLSVYAGLRASGSQAGEVFKATGHTGWLARLAVLKAVLMVPALVLAARIDATAVAWALAGVTALTAAISLGASAVLLRLSARRLFAAIRPGLLHVLVLAGLLEAWRRMATSGWPLVELSVTLLIAATTLFTVVGCLSRAGTPADRSLTSDAFPVLPHELETPDTAATGMPTARLDPQKSPR